MKFKLLLLFFMCFHLTKAHSTFEPENKINPKGVDATLNIDMNGSVIIKNIEWNVQNHAMSDGFCRINLSSRKTNREYELIQHKVSVKESDMDYRIECNDFYIENKALPIKVILDVKKIDNAFSFSGEIQNESDDWVINSIDYKLAITGESPQLYWPYGLGEYIKDLNTLGARLLQYPSGHNASLPWFTLNNGKTGLYIGCHDPAQQPINFRLNHDNNKNELIADISISLHKSNGAIPKMIIYPYAGKWHQAARYYRQWYDQFFSIASPPQWVINDTGWLLAILKQQDGEIMWKYNDLDKLCDIAERHNLTTIGLFGWAHGGHDHLYPDYVPDHLMGGRAALKEAIKRVQKRGLRVILYANGKIMDTSTDYYHDLGIETMLVQKNLRPDIQFYIKQRNVTPVIFAQACVGSEIWRKTMVDLAFQALSLGANGILYDQIGVLEPLPCYSDRHDHMLGESDIKSRVELIKEINEKTKAVKSDFIVMTEGVNDVISKDIDYTHGLGKASSPAPNGFPELFRYTFPEFILTQRNPNPAITRTNMNYATVYGLKHEIESRYNGDVKYLMTGVLDIDEYSNVVSPPDFASIQLAINEKAVEYVHSVIAFEKKNADLLMHGRFVDEEGVIIDSKDDIIAKAFLKGNKMGVIVWNRNLEKKGNFKISAPGFLLKCASDPRSDKTEAFSPIDPNSIRLLIFEQ
ncbi:DUF6259 domain-containing protein [Parabacteroides sp. Marseille-P3160]|uniref:DUF6259 domain-containing protein n=1 Tax=Parabacteroides sp. Marseille-P3160 TaxID=1917887 RepID=UPI0011196F66|nr:DUF6259 domain-containing protein [Parabacteroides sp. Marseille-P3160]